MTKLTTDPQEFERALIQVRRVIDERSEPPAQVFRVPMYAFRMVDLFDVGHPNFFGWLQQLNAAIGDETFSVIVLRPDPVDYFHRHFGKYPLLRFSAADTGQSYVRALDEDPGNSPADAMAYNSTIIVLQPESSRWVLYGDRDNDLAIIGLQDAETLRALDMSFPSELLCSATRAIDLIIAPGRRGPVPEAFREEFVRNYTDTTRSV